MLIENEEQTQKLKTGRKIQLGNWYTKKSTVVEKSNQGNEKKTEEISKISTKEERTRSGKNDTKEVTKAKVMTRHSDIINAQSAKHKNNFKRKMST